MSQDGKQPPSPAALRGSEALTEIQTLVETYLEICPKNSELQLGSFSPENMLNHILNKVKSVLTPEPALSSPAWEPKVGDRVALTGTLINVYSDDKLCEIRIDGDGDTYSVLKTALRPCDSGEVVEAPEADPHLAVVLSFVEDMEPKGITSLSYPRKLNGKTYAVNVAELGNDPVSKVLKLQERIAMLEAQLEDARTVPAPREEP